MILQEMSKVEYSVYWKEYMYLIGLGQILGFMFCEDLEFKRILGEVFFSNN